jgi:hypothetical protein
MFAIASRKTRLLSWYGLLLLVVLPVVVPTLTEPIESRSIDPSLYHIYRGIVFSDVLADGWWYPRWAAALNGGLGSPVFSFYSPGVYFCLDGIHRLGLSHVFAWRILMAIAVVVAGTGAYALALALGRRSDIALLAATTYMYAPAFMYEVWQRGSPQALLSALLPWAFLALWRLGSRPSGLRVAAAALALGTLPLVHNIGALLSLLLFAQFVLYLFIKHGRSILVPLAVAGSLGLSICAVHIIPFLVEREYVQLDNATDEMWSKPVNQGLDLAELGFWPMAYDAGIPNLNAMDPAYVDALQGLLVLACLVAAPRFVKKATRPARVLYVSCLGTAIAVVVLQLDISTSLWRPPALEILQFRWRLLSLLAPSLLLVVSLLAQDIRSRQSVPLAIAVTLAVVGLSLPRLYPGLLPVVNPISKDASPSDVTLLAFEYAYDLSTGEFQPIWREWGYSEEEMKWAGLTPVANLPEGAQWLTDKRTPRSRRTRFTSPVPFEASLHLLYFPGWQVKVDGVPAVPYPSEGGGYLTVPVPAGEHEIVATYGGTRVQHVSAAISVLGILGCVVLAVAWRGNQGGNVEEPVAYAAPGWQVAVVIAALVAAKLLWIDPHTTWFRHASTRDAIYGATQHVDVTFDNSIQLHGYRLDRRAFEPGDELTVTLYWSADGFPDKQYPGSFVHLLGGELNEERGDYLWGQSDVVYRPGRWEQGKLFADVHTLTVDPAAPDGEYSLEIGWWWPETGQQFQAEIGVGSGTLHVAEPGYLILDGLTVQTRHASRGGPAR